MKNSKKHFSKQQLHSISRVVYQCESIAVLVSNQIQVKKAIMDENSKRFILAYTSTLLKREVLQNIGLKGEEKSAIDLIMNGIRIPGTTEMEHSFLKLLYNSKIIQIKSRITVQQWNHH